MQFASDQHWFYFKFPYNVISPKRGLYIVPKRGLYVGAWIVASLLMVVLLAVCVGVLVCYCGWRKKKACEFEPHHTHTSVYMVCKLWFMLGSSNMRTSYVFQTLIHTWKPWFWCHTQVTFDILLLTRLTLSYVWTKLPCYLLYIQHYCTCHVLSISCT